MGSATIDAIRELCEKEDRKYFKTRSLAAVLEEAGCGADRNGLLSLVRQIVDADMFMCIDAVASGLQDLARDDDEYAGLVRDVTSRMRGDLAQGTLIDALVRIGSLYPGMAVRIARRLVRSGDADSASLLAGGAWLGAPKEAGAMTNELLTSPDGKAVAAGIRCLRIGFNEHGTPDAGYVFDRAAEALDRGGGDAAGEAMEALLDTYDGKGGRAASIIEDAAKKYARCKAVLANRIRRWSPFDDETSLRYLAACAKDWTNREVVRETHYALGKLAETSPDRVAGIVAEYMACGRYHAEYTGHVLQKVGEKRPVEMVKVLIDVARRWQHIELEMFLPNAIRDVSERADCKLVFKALLDSLGKESDADSACLMLNAMVTKIHDVTHDDKLSRYALGRLKKRALALGIDADRITSGEKDTSLICSALIHAMRHRPPIVDYRAAIGNLDLFPTIKRLFTRDWFEKMERAGSGTHPLVALLARISSKKAGEASPLPVGESGGDRFNREFRLWYESYPELLLRALDAHLERLEKSGHGVAGYVKHMKNAEQFYDTTSEISFVASFAARHVVTIEPEAGAKKLDALIEIGSQSVYVEVFRPRMWRQLELLEGTRGIPTDRAGKKVFDKLKNQLAAVEGLDHAIVVAIDVSESEIRPDQIDDYVLGPLFFKFGLGPGQEKTGGVLARDEEFSMHCRDSKTDIISAVVCFKYIMSTDGEHSIAGTIRTNPHAKVTLSRSTLREIERVLSGGWEA